MRNHFGKGIFHYCLSGTVLLSLATANTGYAFKALHDSLDVPENCAEAYKSGFEAYTKLLENTEFRGDPEEIRFSLDAITPSFPDCETYVLAGAFEAQTMVQERVFTEYLFEYSEMRTMDWPATHKKAVDELYDERFHQVGLPDDTLKRVESTWNDDLSHSTASMKGTLKKIAQDSAQAVPFGRFLFTIGGGEEPLTLFDYIFVNDQLKRNEGGTLEFEKGSYNRAAEKLLQQAITNAQEYLDWNPSFFWGSDSAISALWHSRENSGRATKERMYFDNAAKSLSRAYELNIDPKPFLSIVNTMNKKSKATLEAEIAVLDQLRKWVIYEMPLFALSFVGVQHSIMGIGKAIYSIHDKTRKVAWALGAARVMATPARALNITIGATLSMVGFSLAKGTYEFVSDVKDGKTPAQFGHFFSYMVNSTFRGISYATYVNTMITGFTFLGGSAFLGARALILTGKDLAKFFTKNGVVSATMSLPKLSYDAAKWYLNQWKYDRLKFSYVALKEGSFNVLFEWGSREWLAQAENDKTLKLVYFDDEGIHFNRRGMISVGGALFLGTAFRPLDNIGLGQKFHPTRLVSWRAAGIATDTATWVMGGFSTPRYLYEMTWSFTIGPQVSENLWNFRNGQMKKNGLLKKFFEIDPIKNPSVKNYVTDFTMDLTLQASLKLPARYAKVFILENYIDGKQPLLEDMEKLRAFLIAEVNPRIELFSKEDLLASVNRLREYYRTEEGRLFVLSLINEGNWRR